LTLNSDTNFYNQFKSTLDSKHPFLNPISEISFSTKERCLLINSVETPNFQWDGLYAFFHNVIRLFDIAHAKSDNHSLVTKDNSSRNDRYIKVDSANLNEVTTSAKALSNQLSKVGKKMMYQTRSKIN